MFQWRKGWLIVIWPIKKTIHANLSSIRIQDLLLGESLKLLHYIIMTQNFKTHFIESVNICLLCIYINIFARGRYTNFIICRLIYRFDKIKKLYSLILVYECILIYSLSYLEVSMHLSLYPTTSRPPYLTSSHNRILAPITPAAGSRMSFGLWYNACMFFHMCVI